jgi:hypothetical protein
MVSRGSLVHDFPDESEDIVIKGRFADVPVWSNFTHTFE